MLFKMLKRNTPESPFISFLRSFILSDGSLYLFEQERALSPVFFIFSCFIFLFAGEAEKSAVL